MGTESGGSTPASQNALVIRESRAVLAHHGRTFNLAGKLLPAAHRNDAAIVYAFCRLADDLADEAPDPNTAKKDLAQLTKELEGHVSPRPVVAAFLDVCQRRSIDSRAANYLLQGMLSDLDPVALPNDEELIRYSYCAAGTVGLMMSGVIGVCEPKATPHAIDLGIGMQITNICRDVLEDARRGRIYLPLDRLDAVGIHPNDLLHFDVDAAAVQSVVNDLLGLAESYYASADAGMKYIPWRARTAILCASRMYRAIGLQIINGPVDVMQARAWVPMRTKLRWLSYGLLRAPFMSAKRHEQRLHIPIRSLPGAAV